MATDSASTSNQRHQRLVAAQERQDLAREQLRRRLPNDVYTQVMELIAQYQHGLHSRNAYRERYHDLVDRFFATTGIPRGPRSNQDDGRDDAVSSKDNPSVQF